MKLLRWVATVTGLVVLLTACQGGVPAPTDPPQVGATDQDNNATGAAPITTTGTSLTTPAARFVSMRGGAGTLEILRDGAGPGQAEIGEMLFAGDGIRTSADGRAVLELDDGTVLAVAPDSSLVLASLDGSLESPISHFSLETGQVFSVRVAGLASDATYEIESPNALGLIRGSAMSIAYYDSEGVTVVTCLIGHCGAADGGATVDLGTAQSCTITSAELCTPRPMDAAEMQAWARALYEIRRAGLDVEQAVIAEGCTCQDTDYSCADGTAISGYAGCLAGSICSCQDTVLGCDDGSQHPGDPVCEGNNGTGVTCQCSGPHLYCDDGSVSYRSPSCSGDFPCVCNGLDLVCGETNYANDPSCAASGAGVTCTCVGTVLWCSDGSRYFDSPQCSADLPCACQGSDLVCTDLEGVATTYPGYCGGLPGGGDEGPQCACVGMTLYCADGTIRQDDPICAGDGSGGDGDTGSRGAPRCTCYDGDLICTDGTVKHDDPSCGG